MARGQRCVMTEWFRDNEILLWFLGAFSAVSVVAAIFLTPWAISFLSADYFMPGRDRIRTFGSRHPMIRWTGLILKNVGGGALVISGIALLALPGQGLLTILVGLALMNFPGKRSQHPLQTLRRRNLQRFPASPLPNPVHRPQNHGQANQPELQRALSEPSRSVTRVLSARGFGMSP